MIEVFGASVSYFTGKLESYLRYKGLPYVRRSIYDRKREILDELGVLQHPVVRLPDGRWMTDTTPMLGWFENAHPANPVMPSDPVVRFLALLVEDYADEWLWRAAMHYRWSYEPDRALLSRLICDDQLAPLPWPRPLKLRMVRLRQRVGFVVRDGVNSRTRAHVEAGYRAALAGMSAMLAGRPFLLGNAPSIADFGLMGPMLRHFGQDPTPAEIMRNEAPAVYEWVARTWNAQPPAEGPRFASEWPADGAGLLREVAETHLVQLRANAVALGEGRRRFDVTIQGCRYGSLPVSRYRVWCLEQLRGALEAVARERRGEIERWLGTAAMELLDGGKAPPASGHDTAGTVPFGPGLNVYGRGVPFF